MVTDYLEGALPPRLHDAVTEHLAACPHCREYLEQLRQTIAVSRGLSAGDMPADVVDALARAFADYRRSPD